MNIVGEFEKVSKKQFEIDLYNNLGIKRDCYADIILPKRATIGSCGYDFYSPIDIVLKPLTSIKLVTGIRVKIEDGYYLQIVPRSSLGFKYHISLLNTVGIIDSDYYNSENQGHIIVALYNGGDKELVIKKGDRLVQGIFSKYYLAIEEEVKDNRNGGIGSTNMRP